MDDEVKAQLEAAYAKAKDTTGMERCYRCDALERPVRGIVRLQCTCGRICRFCGFVDIERHAAEHGIDPKELAKVYRQIG